MAKKKKKKDKSRTTELLQVKSDLLFHDLVCAEDKSIIEWIIMRILGCSYEEVHGKVTVGNIRLTRISDEDRSKYLDLIIEYDNYKIIFELNNSFRGIYTRNIIYAGTVLINNYKLNDDKKMDDDYYKKVVKILLINLNWYPSYKKSKKVPNKTGFEIPYSEYDIEDYLVKFINVNLDYYTNICYDDVSEQDKFYKLLTVKSKRELEEILKKEKMLEYYGSKLIKLSSNKKYKEVVMDKKVEENVEKQTSYLAGKYDGIEQGSKTKEKDIIKNMLDNKFPIEVIAKAVGLTVKEIKSMVL